MKVLEAIAQQAFTECLKVGMTIEDSVRKVRRQWPNLPERFFESLGR